MSPEVSTDTSPASGACGYKVGAFRLFLESKSLLLHDEEIRLEPQVFDVLAYLCANKDHYVSLQELHENVWQGRVVSDAAVRRSLSKLRSIFALDTSVEQYIKSAHKRGYTLICEVVPLSNVPEDHHRGVSKPTSGSSPKLENTWSRKQFLGVSAAMIFTSLLLVFVYYGGFTFDSAPKQNVDGQVNVIDYPGEKSHIALSDDKRFLAFAGKVVSYQGYQLFVKDLEEDQIKQLTFDDKNVVRIAFSADQRNIAYIDMTPGQSRLKLIDFVQSDSTTKSQTLVDDFYIMSDLAVLPDGSGIIFSGMKDKTTNSQTFLYDYETQQVRNLVSDFSEHAHDYKVTLSDDAQYLAVATTLNHAEEQLITVYNMHNKKVVNRFYHDKHIYELSWLDKHSLLLLDHHCISKIDFDSGKKDLMTLNDGKSIRSFYVKNSEGIVILRETNEGTLFLELDSDGFNLASQSIISHNDDTLEQVAFFGGLNTLLKVRKKDDFYRLTVKNKTQPDELEILKTSLALKVLDVASDASRLLLSLDGLMALFDVRTNEVSYVESDGQTVFFDGAISPGSDEVLYGIKTRDGWSIKRYSVDTGSHDILVEGFKSIRATSEGYVLVTESGEFFTADKALVQITPLNQGMLLDSETMWYVRDDLLYWSEFNGKSVGFFTFNPETGHKGAANFDGTQFSAQFDIDPSGQRVLIKSQKFPETEVTELSLVR